MMVGSDTITRTTDPSDILSGVCAEGWELAAGSCVFVHEEEVSRDKFLSSGQNIAIKGRTVGYYVFRRSSEGWVALSNVWEEAVASQPEYGS